MFGQKCGSFFKTVYTSEMFVKWDGYIIFKGPANYSTYFFSLYRLIKDSKCKQTSNLRFRRVQNTP